MSVPKPTVSDRIARTVTDQLSAVLDAFAAVLRTLVDSVQFVAFWVATLLPVVYLPLLAMGVATKNPTGFAGLLGLNGVAFVLGHPHNQS